MTKTPWVTEKEASKLLGVNEETLRLWREIGYLKQGTHWRICSAEAGNNQQSIFYHIRWSQEVIAYWREHDAKMSDIAA